VIIKIVVIIHLNYVVTLNLAFDLFDFVVFSGGVLVLVRVVVEPVGESAPIPAWAVASDF